MARYVRKEFLSPCSGESGSIVCEIETPLVKDIYEHQLDNPRMSGSIRISDCSRHTLLDFDCSGQSAFEKRVAKLDKLLAEIQGMRDQYIAMWENNLRNVEHKRRSLAQEATDKANAARERAANYRGPR